MDTMQRIHLNFEVMVVRNIKLRPLVAGFFNSSIILYCCVVSEPEQQQHQSYRNKVVGLWRPLIEENQVSYRLLTVNIKALKTRFVEVRQLLSLLKKV